MISQLDRKVLRDLGRMKGQAISVALVMACGLAMLTMARSLINSLESARSEYYQANRFAEIFARLKRAPNSVAERAAEIPGVAGVQAGISVQVTLDLPGLDEPASGLVLSVPDRTEAELNRLFLRSGRWLRPGGRGEVLVGEAFAKANKLQPGQKLTMLLNGRRQVFAVAGIVLSPEFIFESRPGAALPDNRTYGIFWMPYEEVSKAFDLYGAFNYLTLKLAPGASEKPVIAALDLLLRTYGGRGAHGRGDHPSHIRVSDEIRVLQTLSIGFPVVFLSVAAFMTNSVLTRLLAMQREQIAILKAFGFSNRSIVLHYLKFAFAMVLGGVMLGAMLGVLLGHQLVGMYEMFFRFPDLSFHFDRSALVWAVLVGVGSATIGVFGAVRRAARLPPAEAMRPEPPANFRPAFVERTGIAHLLSHSFRIAVRNLERKPMQALFTVAGLSLATAILIVPNAFRDSVKQILGVQWDIVSRDDMTIGLVEPASLKSGYAMQHLPGVVRVEPFRNAPVRLHFGSRSRQLAIRGLPPGGNHLRVVTADLKEVPIPSEGLIISSKLGEVLGARIGDEVLVEVLEGKQIVRPLPLVAFSEDMAGVAAYMDVRALNHFLVEGNVINGASFTIDGGHRADFLRALKGVPKIGWVAIKETLRENFRATTAASINLIQSIYLTFAIVVAFGVVYNNARISLAERSRELATLRVVGFSQNEVGAVLITELVILALLAIPAGLLLGTGFATGIIGTVNTETVRLPLVLTSGNYAFAALVVMTASFLSALVVLRRLKNLDLVSALRAPE